MRDILLIINQQSPRTIQNFLIWRFMIYHAWTMPKRFRSIVEQHYKSIVGCHTENWRRSVRCATCLTEYMNSAISKIYINKYLSKNARQQVLTIIGC